MPGEQVTGENIIVEVAALAAGSMAEPADAEFKELLGTSTGIQIGEQTFTFDKEFGVAASKWDDNKVVGRNWTSPFAGNWHYLDAGYLLVEAAGMKTDDLARLFLRIYLIGKVADAPVFKGVSNVTGFNIQAPRNNAITNNWNFAGAGELIKASYVPPI